MRVADIVQAGKVRIAIGLAPIFANRDPRTSTLRGVAVDLADALAAPNLANLLPRRRAKGNSSRMP
jgi:ABC-type amino acid transport substrate-binding protein